MLIAFLTPFYNEFALDKNGAVIYGGRKLLPIEDSFSKLLAISATADVIPVPNKIYECDHFRWYWKLAQCTFLDAGRNALVSADGVSNRLDQNITDGDRLWFIDADISFTISDILSVLNRKKPLCGGAYIERTMLGCFTCGLNDEHGRLTQYLSSQTTGVVEMDMVGAGFFCIDREVVERMGYPWFQPIYKRIDLADGVVSYPIRDDRYFCMKAKELGYRIYVDCDVKLKHHLTKGYTMEQEQSEPTQAKLLEEIGVLYLQKEGHEQQIHEISSKILQVKQELVKRAKEKSPEPVDTELKPA